MRASQEAALASCKIFVFADEVHCFECIHSRLRQVSHLSLVHAPTELLSANRVCRICTLQRPHTFVSIEVCYQFNMSNWIDDNCISYSIYERSVVAIDVSTTCNTTGRLSHQCFDMYSYRLL